jgi:ribosomal protein S18 acetylase RimI-like enzyme
MPGDRQAFLAAQARRQALGHGFELFGPAQIFLQPLHRGAKPAACNSGFGFARNSKALRPAQPSLALRPRAGDMSAMSHALDRPVWSALTSRQAELALGGDLARRFAPEYGPFGAAAEPSPQAWAALLALSQGGLAIVEAEPAPLPQGVRAAQESELVQMAMARLAGGAAAGLEIVPLTDADAPQMRALAELTRPGPFSTRTHRLGDFVGVRQGGRLVAMAGERMKPEGFTEVSGVCTHPDWRGRGYAAALIRVVASRILQRGETPFLHSYASNAGAIALYETLGFRLRSRMTMRVLTPA